MDSDLLEACARLAESLNRVYPLVTTGSMAVGLALFGASLLSLRRAGEGGRPLFPAIAGLACGALLLSFTSLLDALSLSLFQASAPRDLSSVEVGSLGGLESLVRLALGLVMLVGAWQRAKGLVLLRASALGGNTFWPGLTHLFGGVLCLNVRAFMLALGGTMGGPFQELVQTLLGS